MTNLRPPWPTGHGFFEEYLKFTLNQESPEIFHFWSAIAAVSAALGRKCYIDRGYYSLFPNMFIILVAGSAVCRKSTAIGIAANLMSQISHGPDLLEDVPGVKVIKGKITPEAFIEELATDPIKPGEQEVETYPSVLVHSSELSVLLSKQTYAEPLIYILTDLFDCPEAWPYKTKNRGKVFLKNVFISILAATTPESLAEGITESALKGGGFASRIMFIYASSTDRCVPFPELMPKDRAREDDLRSRLARIARISGKFMLEESAREWYADWYKSFMQSVPDDTRVAGMVGRKHDHVLRLGMILAASYERQIIYQGDLEAALAAIEQIQATTPLAMKLVGGDDTAAYYERVYTILRRFLRISHTQLLRRAQPISADMLGTVLKTLIQQELIEYERVGDHGRLIYQLKDTPI